MLNNRFHDKICYVARNNNLSNELVLRIVDVLSNYNHEKVEINPYIRHDLFTDNRDFDYIGKYYNWGLMQVPGYFFANFQLNKEMDFSANNIIQLINPASNLDAGCKMIRYFKKNSKTLEDALYKYISCDLNDKVDFKIETILNNINRILE